MFFFVLGIFLSLSNSIYPQEHVADYYTITRLTDAVYKRFYLIKRMEKAVDLLYKIPSSLIDKLETESFHNECIRNAIAQAKSYHSLKPLYHIWKMFSSYQYVNDQSFTDDYVKLICFFYLTFFMQTRFDACSLEQKLYWIDMAIEEPLCTQMVQLKKESFAQVTTDDIVKRYFILKRISNPMYMVTKISKQEAYLLHKIPLISYKSKKIFKLWQDMYQYKYVGDDEHMRYFLWYIFIMLYKHKNNVDLLPLMFSQSAPLDFEHMDIEELLTAIDSIVNNFNHINQHYQSSGLSLVAWVTKYWWVPTLVITSIVVNILKHYYIGPHNALAWGSKVNMLLLV